VVPKACAAAGAEKSSDVRIERRLVDSRAAASAGVERRGTDVPYRSRTGAGSDRIDGEVTPETSGIVPETASLRHPPAKRSESTQSQARRQRIGAMNCPPGQEREGRQPSCGRVSWPDDSPDSSAMVIFLKMEWNKRLNWII